MKISASILELIEIISDTHLFHHTFKSRKFTVEGKNNANEKLDKDKYAA